jgi:hypothetical protein
MTAPARFATALLVAALLAPGLAQAKPGDDKRHAAAFSAVLDCRKLTDGAARLACYDAAAAKMDEAEAKGEIVVIDRTQAREAHREAFGLPIPSLSFVTRALQPEEVDQIRSRVKAARADGYGKWTFVLEDGAVWRQIAGDLLRDPKAGSAVVIQRGAIGSFKMSVDNQPTIKVHRDQ